MGDCSALEVGEILRANIHAYRVSECLTVSSQRSYAAPLIMTIQHQHSIGCITLITCSPRIGTVLERPAGCLRQVPFELIAAGVLNEELGKSITGDGPCWEPPERIRSSNQGGAKIVFDTYVREMLEREASGTEAKASALAETASKALHGVALMRIEVMNEISMPQVFLWMQESSLFSPGSLLFNPQPGISFRASDLVRNLVLACYMDLPLEDQEEAYHRLWLEPLELEYPGPDAMDSLLASFIEAKHPGILRQGRRYQGHRGLPAVLEGSGRSPAGPQEAAVRRHVSGFEKTINSLVEGGAAAGGQQMRGAVLYSKWVSVIQEDQIKAASAAAAAASMPPPPAASPGASGKKRGHGGGPREEEEDAEQGGPRVQAAQGPTSLVGPRRAVRDATEGLLRDLAAFAGTAIGEGREGGGSCRGPASSAPCLPPSAPPSAI